MAQKHKYVLIQQNFLHFFGDGLEAPAIKSKSVNLAKQ